MTLRRLGLLSVLVVVLGLAAPSLDVTAATVPTLRLAIVHVLHGCHSWARASKILGPSRTFTVKRGTKLVIRVNCPMEFDFVQVAGPPLRLGGRFYAGTTRTIAFRKAGVYKLRATNVESSDDQGLETLGPDNVLRLTVRVRRP
jgi:hypothetical protein